MCITAAPSIAVSPAGNTSCTAMPLAQHAPAIDPVNIAAAAAVGALAYAVVRCRHRRYRTPQAPAGTAAPPARMMRLPPAAAPREFNIASFNMLTPAFEHWRNSGYVKTEHRRWAHRRRVLRDVLCGMGMDVIAVQEALIATFEEDFGEYMRGQGWGAVAPFDKSSAKAGGKGDKGLAKTAVFYRRAVFDLLWTNHRSRVLLCALAHRATGEVVFVVNCHLEGHPRKAAQRFFQLRSALECLQAAARTPELRGRLQGVRPEDMNVVVCGDFNSSQQSAPYVLLDTGALTPEFSDPFNPAEEITKAPYAHPFALHDAYRGRSVPTYVAANTIPRTIDFVFASTALDVRATLQLERGMLAEALWTKTPNAWHPSDHFPVGATVAFNRRRRDT